VFDDANHPMSVHHQVHDSEHWWSHTYEYDISQHTPSIMDVSRLMLTYYNAEYMDISYRSSNHCKWRSPVSDEPGCVRVPGGSVGPYGELYAYVHYGCSGAFLYVRDIPDVDACRMLGGAPVPSGIMYVAVVNGLDLKAFGTGSDPLCHSIGDDQYAGCPHADRLAYVSLRCHVLAYLGAGYY
jgi:hypothetical protein